PMSYRFTALAYCAGFAYTLSPGKIGEMVRARYYLPLGVPLTKVTAAFFTERLMDLVAIAAMATLVFATSRRYDGALVGAAVILAAALAALAAIPWASLSARIARADQLPAFIRAGFTGFATALMATQSLMRPRILITGFSLGLIAWGLEGMGLGLLG